MSQEASITAPSGVGGVGGHTWQSTQLCFHKQDTAGPQDLRSKDRAQMEPGWVIQDIFWDPPLHTGPACLWGTFTLRCAPGSLS